MNYLLFSDLHISQSSLQECIVILEEIGMIANKYNVDTLINLGDTFDNFKPSSIELDIFSTFLKRLNKKIIILAADSHESTTQEESIINHFGILNDTITVVKEYHDENHMYCGHFTLEESKKSYGSKRSKKEFEQYKYVFLGHQHSYEIIKPNICHLGSSRYVDFSEVEDKAKVVCLIENYKEETEKVHFLALKSPIPMVQLQLQQNSVLGTQNEALDPKESISQAQSASNLSQNQAITELISKLDKLAPKTKVKVVIKDFESFRQFLPLANKYSNKFQVFKYDTQFEVISANIQKPLDTETKTFKESFQNWLKNQIIDPKILEILQKEIE